MTPAKIRLILVDIDGTLVGRDGVHDSTWSALDEARARGVMLGICTGRIGHGRALEYARQVAPEGFHIFQSGAVVTQPDRPAAYASTLPVESFRQLVAISRREGEPVEAFSEAGFFVEATTPLNLLHAEHLAMEPVIGDLLDVLDSGATLVRAQWVVDESRWEHFRALTEPLADLEANPATAPWAPGAVFSNHTRRGTSKATALRWLAAHLGLGVEEVAMVGDGENDLDAIEAAGLGIAMGNAHESVKARAQVVVGDADEGGLAQAVRLALARG